MTELMNVDKALELILDRIMPTNSISLPLLQAHELILSEDVIASQNQPPFDNSSMDGYAIIASDSQNATKESPIVLQVVMDITAGTTPTQSLQTGQAARIMTGAPIPQGATAVIPIEDTDGNWANNFDMSLEPNVSIFKTQQEANNIRQTGESVKEGQLLLVKGTRLNAAKIGLLASLGIASVSVHPKPRVAVLTNGDELTLLGEPLQAGKIYDANTPALCALLLENHCEPIIIPAAKDTPQDMRRMFNEAISHQPDMIISTAGVSVGATDLTRTILEEIGEIGFWKINLRPGKPLAFGKIGKIPFMGLPGNPVSAMVTFDVLVRPALLKMANRADRTEYISALTTHPIKSDGRRSYLRVTLEHKDGQWYATETGTQSSGALISMVLADGLMIVPEDIYHVETGTQLNVKLIK
jgi:molybdopterin molybdotransferase